MRIDDSERAVQVSPRIEVSIGSQNLDLQELPITLNIYKATCFTWNFGYYASSYFDITFLHSIQTQSLQDLGEFIVASSA